MSADGSHRPGDGSEFSELDDTLADGPSPIDLPAHGSDPAVPDGVREWLAEQRLVHGLLRVLNSNDAAAREGRIVAILERIDAGQGQTTRRHWWLVSAAALLLASLGVWFALPPALPTAEAAMARAVDELQQPLDRRFRVLVQREGFDDDEDQEQLLSEFALTTRPGTRFLIECVRGRLRFGGRPFGNGRVGCDGETLWIDPRNPMLRRSVPLADREQILEGFGDLLDAGYLDVHDLVARLPQQFRLRVVGRLVGDDGRRLLRIVARRLRVAEALRVRSAELLVDEATGMVIRIDARLLVRGLGRRHVEVEYLGVVGGDGANGGPVDYSRPW